MGMQWRKLDGSTVRGTWNAMLDAVRALPANQAWRYGVAGDLPGTGERIDARMMGELARANEGKRGWCYTHKQPHRHGNGELIAEANRNGFTVNLSADDLKEADELEETGVGPVCVTLPSTQLTNTVTPAGRKVVICPAVTHGRTCAECLLCTRRDRSVIVGFPAHGQSKSRVDERLKNTV